MFPCLCFDLILEHTPLPLRASSLSISLQLRSSKWKEDMWTYPVGHGNYTSREARCKSKELWWSTQWIMHFSFQSMPSIYFNTEERKENDKEIQHTWHHCLTVCLRNNTTQRIVQNHTFEMTRKRQRTYAWNSLPQKPCVSAEEIEHQHDNSVTKSQKIDIT